MYSYFDDTIMIYVRAIYQFACHEYNIECVMESAVSGENEQWTSVRGRKKKPGRGYKSYRKGN